MERALDPLAALVGAPRVVSGATALAAFRTHACDRATAGAVLIADEAVVATGYLDRLRAEVIEGAAHVLPPGEPTADSVEAAAEAVRTSPGALVVGVGGGSALDTAKLAVAVAAGTADVESYALAARPLPANRRIVAVPTTSGTGSEVTRTCVFTTRDGRKVWVWGDELLPQLVVLDPAATATVPPTVTAATGLDAFVHAVEALTGRRASDAIAAPAVAAVELVLANLPAAVADGGDLDARSAMQVAATLAGAAIEGGGTGVAHTIGHALGSLAPVSHGAAVAAGLAAALDWNVEGAPDAFAPLTAATGGAPDALVDTYVELLDRCRFADVVRGVGPLDVSSGELATAMDAPENRPMSENNCRAVDDHARHHLAERTLRFWQRLDDGGTTRPAR